MESSENDLDEFTIWVKMMDDSETSFLISSQMTVLDLKQNINEKLSIPIDRQRLLF